MNGNNTPSELPELVAVYRERDSAISIVPVVMKGIIGEPGWTLHIEHDGQLIVPGSEADPMAEHFRSVRRFAEFAAVIPEIGPAFAEFLRR